MEKKARTYRAKSFQFRKIRGVEIASPKSSAGVKPLVRTTPQPAYPGERLRVLDIPHLDDYVRGMLKARKKFQKSRAGP
jgi:hypothetical protein